MTNEWDQIVEEPRSSRRWLWMLSAMIIIFVLGMAATVYILRESEPVRRFVGLGPATINPVVLALPASTASIAPRSGPPIATDVVRRIAGVEQGLAALAERTTETSSNAARAEGLLVAFAARRALDRGTPLGYIEGLLRERFGGGQPQAVATILSASRQPVTLEELQTELDSIAPQLTAREPNETWWTGIRQELSSLVVVRRASVPSIAPVDRLMRARRQLEMGHVDLALAEIARLPGRAAADDWIVKARRYTNARHALDIIETAALLTPHVTPVVAPTSFPPAAQPILTPDRIDQPAP